MHGVVVSCSAEGCQASEDGNGFRPVEWEAKVMGCEFGDDGKAAAFDQSVFDIIRR
jgi:hypothetical protein